MHLTFFCDYNFRPVQGQPNRNLFFKNEIGKWEPRLTRELGVCFIGLENATLSFKVYTSVREPHRGKVILVIVLDSVQCREVAHKSSKRT